MGELSGGWRVIIKAIQRFFCLDLNELILKFIWSMPMFIAALLPIVKGWEQPHVHRRGMDKQNVASTHIGLSFIYRKEEQRQATRGVEGGNLEDILLRERNQTQKDMSCMLPLVSDAESGLSPRDSKWEGHCQGLGEEETGVTYCSVNTQFQLGMIKKKSGNGLKISPRNG